MKNPKKGVLTTGVRRPTAIILSYSRVNSDPRLLRQIEWLQDLGFELTILGYGLGGLKSISGHEVPIQRAAKRFFHYLKPNTSRFQSLFGNYIPEHLSNQIASADLLVVNELEFVPYLNSIEFQTPVYLDLHENHVDPLPGSFLEQVFFGKYWKWQVSEAGKFVGKHKESIFITTVEARIAAKYKEFFDFEKVSIIFNAPKVIDLPQSSVEIPVKLVHHGMTKSNRGIETIVASMTALRDSFQLALMLVKEPTIPFVAAKIQAMKIMRNLGATVRNEPPVNVASVSQALCQHDIALVLGSNRTGNDLYALPNKFFQSIQAGLMIICGPNPAVAEIVREYGLGIVLPDWKRKSLVRAILSLELDQIEHFKANVRASRFDLSESKSKQVFVDGVKEILESRVRDRSFS